MDETKTGNTTFFLKVVPVIVPMQLVDQTYRRLITNLGRSTRNGALGLSTRIGSAIRSEAAVYAIFFYSCSANINVNIRDHHNLICRVESCWPHQYRGSLAVGKMLIEPLVSWLVIDRGPSHWDMN